MPATYTEPRKRIKIYPQICVLALISVLFIKEMSLNPRILTKRVLSLIGWSLLVRYSRSQLKSCYGSDGSETTLFPCDPDAAVSSCCGPGHYLCITNLYCHDTNTNFAIIGTCTERNWSSQACPFKLSMLLPALSRFL